MNMIMMITPMIIMLTSSSAGIMTAIIGAPVITMIITSSSTCWGDHRHAEP